MWLNGIKNSAILIGMTFFFRYIPIMLSCLILITDLLQLNLNSFYRMRGKWKVRNARKSLQW